MTTTCLRSNPCILLLVEDDEDQREGLRRVLHTYDGRFNCYVAASVAEAATVLAQRPIDLVLLDLNLGDGSLGLETLDRVKPLAPNIPIVILSAQDDISVAADAINHGARHYFLKPINVESLVIQIPYIITNHRNYVELQEICQTLRARLLSVEAMRIAVQNVVQEVVIGEADELTSEMLQIIDRLEVQTRRQLRAAQ